MLPSFQNRFILLNGLSVVEKRHLGVKVSLCLRFPKFGQALTQGCNVRVNAASTRLM